MQVLKEDVKNKIVNAAAEEFLLNGFENSSLRVIASQAGITIGNIYSYFSSKDDLFNHVVSPAAEALDDLLSLDFVQYDSTHAINLTQITNKICKVFIENKERFFILMNNSSGSKYENTKEVVITFISKRIKTELFPKVENEKIDPLFAQVLAVSLLSGFMTIFNQYGGDDKRLMILVNELLELFLGNYADRINYNGEQNEQIL
jgi:AcrR family transcriptional regulator